MSSEYSYDQEGQFFPIFILTVTSLVTLPLTYTLIRPASASEKPGPRVQTDYKSKDAAVVEDLRKAEKKQHRMVTRALVAAAGWAILAGMVYLIIVTQRITPKLWNPYDILGISDSASERQLKSHWRKLIRKYHPDKVRPDPAKNETVESLNAFFSNLAKAYQALTDEEVRNNYIQYGHPDGKQSFSIGIALPSFIVSEGNGKYVILIYTLLLGVLLPYVVGSWWYGTKRRSKDGILMESANNLFRQYEDSLDASGIVTVLSSGQEYKDLFQGDKADSDLSKIESRILAKSDIPKTAPYAAGLSAKDKAKLEDLENGPRRKALALLWAYLGRIDLDDSELTKAKYQVAPIARALKDSFLTISLAYGNIKPILGSLQINQHLVQAIAPSASPLLQLPFFTPKIAAAVEQDHLSHLTVQQFLDQPDAQRRELVVGSGLLTEQQYKTALSVGKQIPYFRVAKAFFKVTGERVIIPSSLVSLVIKGRFVPPGTDKIPEINELDLEDVDPSEDDLAALTGRKKTIKGPDGKPISVDAKAEQPPLAFAPYYPRDQSPKWLAFLSDSKQGKIAVPPFSFGVFDHPLFDEQGNPTFAMQTFKAQFAAPPQPGHYTFVLHVVCDSYVGFDTRMEVTLVVEDASKVTEMTAEDDISEPEEDSIAGQMRALKGGQVPSGKLRKKVQEESDDESGTDEEDDDSSATNTDTEDES